MASTVRRLKTTAPPPSRRQAAKLDLETKTAEFSATAGAIEEAVPVRKETCLRLLADGFVNSFVDFFFLYHRADTEPASATEMVRTEAALRAAETGRRHGDVEEVSKQYSALAEHYAAANDTKTAVYFFDKCLEIARISGNAASECHTERRLGLAYERRRDLASALAALERALALARAHELAMDERPVMHDLLRLYRKYAAAQEKGGHHDSALATHLGAIKLAQQVGDRREEGRANLRAGKACLAIKQPQVAIAYIKNFIAICKEFEESDGAGAAGGGEAAGGGGGGGGGGGEGGDAGAAGEDDDEDASLPTTGPEDPGPGFGALAVAYRDLGRMEDALTALREFLAVAENGGSAAAQADAHQTLGALLSERGEFDVAVRHLQSAFNLRRGLLTTGGCRREQLDAARIALGMAQGNARVGSYLFTIGHDLGALLEWKSTRASTALLRPRKARPVKSGEDR